MNMRSDTDLTHGLSPDALKKTFLDAVQAASRITLPAFRSGMNVDNKETESFDPVTEADREAEKTIRAVIEQNFPDHAIIGEEFPNKQTSSPFSWVIDPIDGTRAFISGLPAWGTLIGLAHEGKTFAGVFSQPFIGETFLGLNGAATYIRHEKETPARVSGIKHLENAIGFTTTPALFTPGQRQAFDRLESRLRLSRYGTDCYAFGLLAAGHVDLVVEPGLKIYDIAALIPIVRAAGGVVTSFSGGAPDQGGDIIAAATPELHHRAMDIMNS